jgi:uncharacterized membrane protein YcaP (DUF421 family)
VGRLREHSPVVRELVQSHPTIIARDGRWLPEALRREGIDEEEAAAALREHGLDSVDACKLAVLETDGTISVVPTDSQVLKGRRRMRYRQRTL